MYASSSFDERGDLKNYARPHNVMPNGVDENNPILFDEELFSVDFLSFINGYAEKLQKKGRADLLFLRADERGRNRFR